MNVLALAIQGGQTGYQPGQVLEGKASWSLVQRPALVEARLFWQTRGFGTEDVKVVETMKFKDPGPQGEGPFRLTFPVSPFSFEGRVVSLRWGVELVAEPGDHSTAVYLVMSPIGRPVPLWPESSRDPARP